MTELHPCAIFANGPPWINTGVCSSVCTRFGFNASFITTVAAPSAPISFTVTGSPSYVYATTHSDNLFSKS